MGIAPPAFSVVDVSKRFADVVALEAISLDVEAGEFVGVIGPSGAGKTTLLEVLAGHLEPTVGDVLVGGANLSRMDHRARREHRRGVGFIHQSLDLVPELRVIANVLAGRLGRMSFLGVLRTLVRPREEELIEAHRCLSRVAIPEKMYARTSKLSGGQMQRVAIARVLYQDPAVIFADEPVSSVDPARARDLLDVLRDINDETQKTVIVSLHNIELARSHCRRLIGMRDGRVVFDRPTGEVTSAELEDLYRLDEVDHAQD